MRNPPAGTRLGGDLFMHSRILTMACAVLAGAVGGPEAPAQGVIYYNSVPSLTAPATLRRANADGANAQTVTLALPSALYPTASRDGRRLLVTSPDPGRPFKQSNNVFAIDLATGGMAKVTQFEDIVVQTNGTELVNDLGELVGSTNFRFYRVNYPWHKAFSPDGSQVAYINMRREGEVSLTRPIPAGSSSDLTVGSGRYPVVDVNGVATGAPTGAYIYLGVDRTGLNQGGDGLDWHPTLNEVVATIAADIPVTGTAGRTSMEGTVLVVFRSFAFGGDPFIRKLTAPSGQIDASINPFRNTAVGAHDYAPAISPDGTRVAYVRHFLRQDTAFDTAGIAPLPAICSIRVINYNGTGDSEILQLAAGLWVTKLSWSPDGTQLVFDLAPQMALNGWNSLLGDVSQSEIHAVNVDGSNPHRLLAAPAAFPSWAPAAGPVTPTVLPTVQVARSGSNVLLHLDGLPAGTRVFLEGSSDLDHWARYDPVIGTGSRQTLTLTPTTQHPAAYYRVVGE